jgi:hypothetical protein
VFRCEDKKAAARVARELLRMGHNRAAFVSHKHTEPYSQRRFEGAAEQFAFAGHAGGIDPVVMDTLELDLLHMLELADFDDALARRAIGAYRTESQAEAQFKYFLDFRKKKHPLPGDPAGARHIRDILSVIVDFDKRGLEKAVFDRLCLGTLTEASRALQTMILYPLFEQAARRKDVTAWICATDGIALTALQFCRERGIAVPKDLSITGFDNEPIEAVEERLTTFDFNTQGAIDAILHYITSPTRQRGPHHHVPVEIEGMVILRETTGKRRTGKGKG